MPSSLIRTESFRKIQMKFNPTLVQLSDFDLWIRLAAIGELHILEESLTAMRILGNKNLSIPTPFVLRRSGIELIEVLERYAENPILAKIPEIFSEIFESKPASSVAVLGGLALYAWNLTPFHILFGNKIISSLLKNDLYRKKLINLYGTKIIQTYFQKRGEVQILWNAQ